MEEMEDMSNVLGAAVCFLIFVPAFLGFLMLLMEAAKSKGLKRTRALIASLVGLMIGSGYLVWGIRSLTVAADAPVGTVLPWFQATWSLGGLSAFFLVYYVILQTNPDFFRKRIWAAVLPVIGTGTFLTLLFAYLPAVATTVQVAFVTDIQVDLALQIVAALLVLLYLAIVPTAFVYKYASSEKVRGTKSARRAYILLLGVLIWFVAWLFEGNRSLPEMNYTMIFARGMIVVAFFVVLVGYRMKTE